MRMQTLSHFIGILAGLAMIVFGRILAEATTPMQGATAVVGELCAVAALIWYLWYNSSKVIPGMQKSFMSQMKEDRDKFKSSLDAERETFQRTLEGQRTDYQDALNRFEEIQREDRNARLQELKILTTPNGLAE